MIEYRIITVTILLILFSILFIPNIVISFIDNILNIYNKNREEI